MMDLFTKLMLAGACLSALAWAVVAQRRTVRRISDAYLRLSHVQRALVLLALVICTVHAQKPSTNDVEDVTGTNEVETVGGGGDADLSTCALGLQTRPSILCPPPISTFSAPYRLESVSTNSDISYAMPADATVRGTWHLTGAYEDVQKVALDGFAFPLGSDLCTSLWASVWGEVRSQIKNASNEIAVVGAPMSAIPDVSRFWTAATSNDTYLITWENFVAGRVSTNEVEGIGGGGLWNVTSAQIEMMRNGDFITRSNEVESVWRRVNPDDWDDDGLPNEDDPAPHYRAEGETFFGPRQDLSVIEHSNNYYWVDLVVSNANAKVKFGSELPSNLQDPVFIARPGETNRIVLLLGKPYVVECPQPFSIVAHSHEDIVVSALDEMKSSVCRPVLCIPVGGQASAPRPGGLLRSGGGGGVSPSFVPEPEGGTVSWNGNYCCVETLSSGLPLFNCDGTCGCGGCTTGVISDTYEGVTLTFDAWHCGCSGSHDDPHPGEDDPEDAPQGPSVSAAFSHDAIIFEDEYENSPGVFVPRRSTDVEAEFYVYGGTNGGSYAFTLTDGGRLRRLGGSYVPRNGTVKAGEDFRIKVRYDAVSASGIEGDIKAKVEFTENGSGQKISSEARLTAVKVELTVATDAPENMCSSRHQYGVCEKVNCSITPPNSAELFALNGASLERQNQFRCPMHSAVDTFEIRAEGVSYTPSVSVIEPADVEAINVYLLGYGVPLWCAGGVGLQMQFRILPLTVSFSEIAVEEVPSNQGDLRGYFAHPLFNNERTHTRDCGAGVWNNVDVNNIVEGVDSTGIVVALPRMTPSNEITDDPTVGWVFGTRTWALPFGWNVKGTTGEAAPYCQFAAGKNILFTIDEFGTVSVTKLGYTATRSIDGLTFLVEE